jgi:hypothetical protein
MSTTSKHCAVSTPLLLAARGQWCASFAPKMSFRTHWGMLPSHLPCSLMLRFTISVYYSLVGNSEWRRDTRDKREEWMTLKRLYIITHSLTHSLARSLAVTHHRSGSRYNMSWRLQECHTLDNPSPEISGEGMKVKISEWVSEWESEAAASAWMKWMTNTREVWKTANLVRPELLT